MQVVKKSVGSCCRISLLSPRLFPLAVAVLIPVLVLVLAGACFALQKHELTPVQGTAPEEQGAPQPSPSLPHEQVAPQPAQPEQGHAVQPAQPEHGQQAAPAHPPAAAQTPARKAEAPHGAEHAGPVEHGAAEHGEAHGPQLPEISPVAGVTFVDAMIALMDHELHGRTLGWRPNDMIIGRFTDDVNNYQLGVLEAIRFTTLRLKDSLTRMGDADTYDPDLEQALNLFMISAASFWFPSAESAYMDAMDHLKKFRAKLENGQRFFYYRRDNLVGLLAVYKDLLGNVNRSLVAPSSWWSADDSFYYAKGVAHVYYEILRVVRVGFKSQLAQTMHGTEIMDEILHELHTAEQINPWIVFNGGYDGFFANHRANLNAPLSEVTHLLGVLSAL